jgi:hypothetical protein
LIIYDSIANVPARANLIKNFTLFREDLANKALPQWMFFTPNMSEQFLLHDSVNLLSAYIGITPQQMMATTQMLHLPRSLQSIS